MSTLALLFAPAGPSFAAGEVTTSGGRNFSRGLLFNPAVVRVLIPIVAIVVGSIVKIIQRSQEHREHGHGRGGAASRLPTR